MCVCYQFGGPKKDMKRDLQKNITKSSRMEIRRNWTRGIKNTWVLVKGAQPLHLLEIQRNRWW